MNERNEPYLMMPNDAAQSGTQSASQSGSQGNSSQRAYDENDANQRNREESQFGESEDSLKGSEGDRRSRENSPGDTEPSKSPDFSEEEANKDDDDDENVADYEDRFAAGPVERGPVSPDAKVRLVRISPKRDRSKPVVVVLVPEFEGTNQYAVTCTAVDNDFPPPSFYVAVADVPTGGNVSKPIFRHEYGEGTDDEETLQGKSLPDRRIADQTFSYTAVSLTMARGKMLVLYAWPVVNGQRIEISVSSPGRKRSRNEMEEDGEEEFSVDSKKKRMENKTLTEVARETKGFLKSFFHYQKKLLSEPLPTEVASRATTHIALLTAAAGLTTMIMSPFL